MATSQTGTSGGASMRGSSSGMQGGMGSRGGHVVSDPAYDLISVLYHTLQGCQTYERYAQDAEQAGQQDLAQFFRDTGQQFERCAERGRQLLQQCLQQGQMGQGGRSGQLSSQMGSSAQQGPASGSQGQQKQMSGAQGQMGSSEYGSRGSTDMGGSGSLGSSGSSLEGGRSGGTRSSGRGSGNR